MGICVLLFRMSNPVKAKVSPLRPEDAGGASRAEMARPRYHQSEIQMYLKCGKMWFFRYAMGIKTPPSAALTVGSSVDFAVSHNLSQKIRSERDLSEEDVLDTFSADFESRKQETKWAGADPGRQKDIGAELIRSHHRVIAPRLRPATVQESFIVRTSAGYDLGGTMDFTERSGVIVDTKTSRLPYEGNAVRRSIQPALYDYAYEAIRGKSATGFRYDVLVKPTQKNPTRVQQIEARVEQKDREWLFDTITQVHRAIQAGVAMPAPEGSWYCSREWCGYWSICKGRK